MLMEWSKAVRVLPPRRFLKSNCPPQKSFNHKKCYVNRFSKSNSFRMILKRIIFAFTFNYFLKIFNQDRSCKKTVVDRPGKCWSGEVRLRSHVSWINLLMNCSWSLLFTWVVLHNALLKKIIVSTNTEHKRYTQRFRRLQLSGDVSTMFD